MKQRKLLPLKIIIYSVLAFFLCVFLCVEIGQMRLPMGKSLTSSFKIASIVFLYLATLLPFIGLTIWTIRKCGKSKTTYIALSLFALSYVIRILFADFASDDYIYFLADWIKEYQSLPIQDCFTVKVGNYAPFYNYFLILFSRLPISSLYLIKILSFYFEVITAIVVVKLIAVAKKEQTNPLYLAITLLLAIPLLNSFKWGQCDVIYSCFAVVGIYFAIRRQSIWCFVMMGLSLSMKMQALLIYPVVLILLLCRNSKGEKYLFWRHIWITPLVFVVINIIPVFWGGSLFKVIEIYLDQIFVGNEGQALWGNCANLFLYTESIKKTSIWYPILTFIFIGIVISILVFIITRVCKTKLNQLEIKDVIFLSAFIPMICVFLMPKMLDRYYYIAEVFMFAYLMISNEKISKYAYVLLEYGILITYMYYFKILKRFLINTIYYTASIFTGVAVVLMTIHFVQNFQSKTDVLPSSTEVQINE